MREERKLPCKLVNPVSIAPNPPVEIRDGLVSKRGDRHALEMEALRMRLAALVGERSGRFLVPELRTFDPGRGLLVMAHVPDLLDLHKVASGACGGAEEVFRAAGQALAAVHRELRLPADKIVPLPAYLQLDPQDNVALHGDFCCNNVCYQRSSGRIVLLDWATAPLLGTTANYGCRYFDLVWFAWSLFFWTPPGRLLQWRPERLIRALAAGYAEIEDRFRWQDYIKYRRLIWWLPRAYWKGKCALVPSSPVANCAQLLGWLRWRRFPGFWQLKMAPPTQGMPQAVSQTL